jgi:GWxTD domain-containing protein
MKKLFLLLFIVCTASHFGQPFQKQPFHKRIYTQTFSIPGDSLSSVFYLYKIPYQNLVFIKDDNHYTAELRLSLEVTDTNSNFVKREIKDWKIETGLFEMTNSRQTFAEGLIQLKLPEGSYDIMPFMTDKNSRELKLENVRVDISGDEFIEPLIINSKKTDCEGQDFIQLTNFENSLPFGNGQYDFIIPVYDIFKDEISVTVLSHRDTVFDGKLNNSFLSDLTLIECEGKILLSDSGEGVRTRNFVLSGIGNKLKEGGFYIIVKDDEEKRYKKNVLWYDKPMSLQNPEDAVKALINIEKEKVVDSLLDIGKEKIYLALVDYWKKKDPTPATEYNELMYEFYSRVDYARKNFGSITGIIGDESDRGRIFIKFGKPDKIERSYNGKGKAVETWIYNKQQRKFVFTDKGGTGEFSLESS